MSDEVNIHSLKQANTEFYPKTVSDAVMVGESTLTEVLASISTGDGVDFDALVELLDDKYLSKITADEAAEVITFLKGIKDGNFVSSSSGWSIGYDSSGNSYMEIDKLLVRMEAIYNELVIQQLSYVGGARICSPAAMTCSKVEEYDSYYRCYFDTGENGEVVQQFEVDDQARCQTFTGSNMKYYWRLVVGVGDDYIDLSKTDCDGYNSPTLTTVWSHTDVVSATDARDATGIGQVIYVKGAANYLTKYDKYGKSSDSYESASGISVTSDDAGNIIMNDYSYISETPNLLKVLDSDGVYHSISFSLSDNCIAQYLSPINGNILLGTATMYIWGSDNNFIDKIRFTDGVQSDITTITTSTTGDYTSEAYAIGDDGDIVTHLRGNQYIAINDGEGNETIITANSINNTAGSAAFIMGGVRYIVYNSGTNYADGFTVANMSTGAVMAVHEPLTNPTATVNNSYSNRLSVQVVNDTRAYIYAYTPGAMIAIYLFTIPESPAEGDDIVLCGNRTNSDRQNCIIETSYGDVSYIQYAGINSYSLGSKEVTVLSPSGNKFVGEFTFTSGESAQDKIESVEGLIEEHTTLITANADAILLQASTIESLSTDYSSLSSEIDSKISEAISDGLIDESEQLVIEAQKATIELTTAELISRYDKIIESENLTDSEKTSLTSYKSVFNVASVDLIAYIDWLLASLTDQTRTDYESAYSDYKSALEDFVAQLDITISQAVISVTSDKISLAVDDLTDDLLATGIDIETGSITVTADSFKVQNNDGETTFTVFEDGKIKSELIDTSGITVTEVATSESGKRVEIKNNCLSMYNNDGDMKLLISGDDLGSSASNTVSTTVSAVAVSGSGTAWDVEETTFATFNVTDSNNTVTIPAIYITGSVTGGGTDYIDNLVVTYYIDGEEVFSNGFDNTSYTIPTIVNPMSVGTHTLSYSVTGRGTSGATYVVNITTDGSSIVVKYISELLQFSGNGMRGEFGNSSIEVVDDGIMLTCGDYRLRISSLGIQKSVSNGEWISL